MRLPNLQLVIQASKFGVPVARLLEAALFVLSETQDYRGWSQEDIYKELVKQVIQK